MNFLKNLYFKTRHILLYGVLLALLIFILKWVQWKFLIVDHALDLYVGLVAVFFTALGVWLALQLANARVKTIVVEKEVGLSPGNEPFIDQTQLKLLKLSNREYEVLTLLSKGCSNAEIGEKLFLSLSTIKTHVSNLYMKMDVKSRTQAIEKAKRLKIIA